MVLLVGRYESGVGELDAPDEWATPIFTLAVAQVSAPEIGTLTFFGEHYGVVTVDLVLLTLGPLTDGLEHGPFVLLNILVPKWINAGSGKDVEFTPQDGPVEDIIVVHLLNEGPVVATFQALEANLLGPLTGCFLTIQLLDSDHFFSFGSEC
jgi:hypothetical protein